MLRPARSSPCRTVSAKVPRGGSGVKRCERRSVTSCRRRRTGTVDRNTATPAITASRATIHVMPSNTRFFPFLVGRALDDATHHDRYKHLRNGTVDQQGLPGWIVDEPSDIVGALHHNDGGYDHRQEGRNPSPPPALGGAGGGPPPG